jgi:AraC family transcriptional regulator
MENGCMTVVCEHIRTNLTADIEVAELAGLVRLSPHYFSLVFRRAVGVSPHQYILQQRVGEARRLLTAGGMTLAEVATHLGFSDQSHFSRAFRKVTGTTPRSFQTSLRSPWLLGTPRVSADAKPRACG